MVPPVVCTDDCNCLGTNLFDYEGPDYHNRGFYLSCYDDEDSVTNVYKYYTETCAAGICELGNYDSYRKIAQSPSDGSLDVDCAASCDTIIYDDGLCLDYRYTTVDDYCRVWCYSTL